MKRKPSSPKKLKAKLIESLNTWKKKLKNNFTPFYNFISNLKKIQNKSRQCSPLSGNTFNFLLTTI